MMTYHSIERTEERVDLNEEQAIRMISRAISRGKTSDAFHGKEKKYLLDRSSEESFAVYYSGYCFILSKERVCITMYSVPSWFGRKRLYLNKEEIRKKKYYNYNYSDIYENHIYDIA